MLAKVEEMPPLKDAIQREQVCKKFKVVSLFSGCGGMDYGLLGGFEFLTQKYLSLIHI